MAFPHYLPSGVILQLVGSHLARYVAAQFFEISPPPPQKKGFNKKWNKEIEQKLLPIFNPGLYGFIEVVVEVWMYLGLFGAGITLNSTLSVGGFHHPNVSQQYDLLISSKKCKNQYLPPIFQGIFKRCQTTTKSI